MKPVSDDLTKISTGRMANRNLTQAEWKQFIGSDIPYKRTCPPLPLGEGTPPATPAAAD